MRLTTLLLIPLTLECAAAQTRIAAPALGYAFDPAARGIRPVLGVPGAALLGDPLDIGFDAVSAAIAPSQEYAVVVAAGQSGARIVRLRPHAAPVMPLAGAIDSDRIVFSSSATAAVLSDSTSGRLQRITGLPDSPAIRDVDTCGEAPRAIAIADDGALAWGALDGVCMVAADGASFSLPIRAAAALALDSPGRGLLAVTRTGDVYLAGNPGAGSNIRQIYSGDVRTTDPVAVQFSRDGSAALIANSAGVLSSVDLTSGTASALSCQCVPAGLHPFGRPGLFRLTDLSNRPILLFDSAPDYARLWFVPAVDRSASR